MVEVCNFFWGYLLYQWKSTWMSEFLQFIILIHEALSPSCRKWGCILKHSLRSGIQVLCSSVSFVVHMLDLFTLHKFPSSTAYAPLWSHNMMFIFFADLCLLEVVIHNVTEFKKKVHVWMISVQHLYINELGRTSFFGDL